jgi:hypothetical protein
MSSKNDNLEKAAKFIVTYIASLAPEYGDRLQIVKDERGFTDLQALGSIVCASLDKGDHMQHVYHALPRPAVLWELLPCFERSA